MERSRHLNPKKKNLPDRVRRIIDHDAVSRGKLGLAHPFAASLAPAIDCAGYVVDPVWLMETSGYTFRIRVQERLRPCSMNGFDWETFLPETVYRAGFNCMQFHRLEQETNLEEE